MEIYIEYVDGSVEVKNISHFAIRDGCLVLNKLAPGQPARMQDDGSVTYIPLHNIRQFIPNSSGPSLSSKKTTIIG